MFFVKTKNSNTEPDVYISDQKVQIVNKYKYLGMMLENIVAVL